MLSITITDRGGAQHRMDFDTPEISIGRLGSNDLVLPKTNVSKQHARLSHKEGRYVILDLQSTNGTYVNGRRIHGPMALRRGDKVYIGDFILGLAETAQGKAPPVALAPRTPSGAPMPRTASGRPFRATNQDEGPTRLFMAPFSMPPPANSEAPEAATEEASEDKLSLPPPPRAPSPSILPPEPPVPESPQKRTLSRPPARLQDPYSDQGPHTSPAVLTPSLRLQGALATLMERLASQMTIDAVQERAFPSDMGVALDKLIEKLAKDGIVGPDLDRRFLRETAISEAVGLGPLDRLLRNQSVREVVVDGPMRILADLGGGLSPVSSFFSTSHSVEVVAKRLLGRAHVELDASRSIHEAVLPDGSHISVLSAPLAKSGMLFSVRCPRKTPMTPDSLITDGMLNSDMLQLLRNAVRTRLNILITGNRGRSVGDVISAIAGMVPDHERLVSIEREPRLSIAHPQVIALSRHGQRDLTCSELLEQARRLRYDRLVFDEMDERDVQTLLTTASLSRGLLVGQLSPNAQAGLNQIQMRAGALSAAQAGDLIRSAIQLVVHVQSERDGARRIENISEVRRTDQGALELQPLFLYRNGFQATGHKASF